MGDSTIDMTHAVAEDQVTGTEKPCLKRVRKDMRYKTWNACEWKRHYRGETNDELDDELDKLSDKIIEVHGKDIREWYDIIEVHGKDIREWYWSDKELSEIELGVSMAQNGLFLLKSLCQVSPKAAKNRKVPGYISQIRPIFSDQEDIAQLENQIPLFVLKMVIEWEAQTYQWSLTGDHVLESILREAVWHTLSPFPYNSEDWPVSVPVNYKSHLLEFVYDNIIDGFKRVSTGSLSHQVLGFVYKKIIVLFESDSTGNDKRIDLPQVDQLHERGVKFAKHDQYKISFDRKTYTLKLPAIEMDHRTYCLMSNLLRFEDMKNAEKPLRCYVEMMNRLIGKAEDVQLLRKEGIIHSRGSDQEVAYTWNDMTEALEKSNIIRTNRQRY